MECIWLHNLLDTKNVSKFVSKQKLHAYGSYYKQNVTPHLGSVPSQKAEILLCQKLCQTNYKRSFTVYIHQKPSIYQQNRGFLHICSSTEPTSDGLTVRNSFYATFMGLYGLIWPILQNQRSTVFYICALILWLKTQHYCSVFAGFSLYLCVFKSAFRSILKFSCFLGSIFTLYIPHFLFQFYFGACKKMLYGLTLFLRSFLP